MNFAVENYIGFLNDYDIAEEGIKDFANSAAGKIKKIPLIGKAFSIILGLIQKLIGFIKHIKEKIAAKFSSKPSLGKTEGVNAASSELQTVLKGMIGVSKQCEQYIKTVSQNGDPEGKVDNSAMFRLAEKTGELCQAIIDNSHNNKKKYYLPRKQAKQYTDILDKCEESMKRCESYLYNYADTVKVSTDEDKEMALKTINRINPTITCLHKLIIKYNAMLAVVIVA